MLPNALSLEGELEREVADLASKNTTAKSTSRKTASRRKKPVTAAERPIMSRGAWGGIMLVLALLSLMSLMPVDGAILELVNTGVSAMVGMGKYVLPFALAGLAALLITKEKGPVRLRVVFISLLPVFIGAIAHAFLNANVYETQFATFGELVESGIAGESGGLLAGGLYVALEWALSSIGALIVLLLLTGTAVLMGCNIPLSSVLEMLRPSEYEYEDEEDDENGSGLYDPPHRLHKVREAAASHAAKKAQTRAEIDVPVDGEEPRKRTLPPIKPIDDYLPSLSQEGKTEEDVEKTDILSLVETPQPEDRPSAYEDDGLENEIEEPATRQVTPPAAPKTASRKKKAEELSEEEQAELNQAINENQRAPIPVYDYPPISLLQVGKHTAARASEAAELKESSECLVDTLQSFNISAQIIGIVRGPSVTRFELSIPRGVKIARISSLSDDIALSLGASSVRIAPIPDKVAVGIEVPNKTVNTVYIRECIASPVFTNAKSRLSFAVGKDITGRPVVGDIAKMPHMLIAGTTGSGKSVCINSMLISILYKSTPEEVRLIMVDPKMVELGNYNGIPHLLIPVVTDPKKAAGALNWAVGEMERRYKLFADAQVRNLVGYNDLMRSMRSKIYSEEEEALEAYQVLPQIVIVIDELADLMMVAAKEVETAICRIAQKARAAGMHLVVATQRPSADVITGIMKANIPSRIAFAVASQIESRIILDQTGAEKLIGKGDMLFAPLGEGKHIRVQGCFISSDEIESVIAHIKKTSTAEYNEEILEHIERQAEQADSKGSKKSPSGSGGGGSAPPSELPDEEDEMLEEAVDVIMECRQASTSMLQRRLKLGYARAGRIMDQIQKLGIVGPSEGSKPRRILISRDEWKEMKLKRGK